MHAITVREDICINIQKIISIGQEIKKILITISQTQPIVEGAPQVSLKIAVYSHMSKYYAYYFLYGYPRLFVLYAYFS